MPVAVQKVNARRANPLTDASEVLHAHPPLTFDQLSWPGDISLTGQTGEVYRSCAQLFVDRLFRFKDGRRCLQTTIETLPRYYNWQMAFLDGFKSHFGRPIDVEKWWALQLVQFTGRDLTQTWTAADSWKKLDEIIRQASEVRTKPNELPERKEMSLQTLIRDLSTIQQRPVLQRKLRELGALRLRVSQDLVQLVDDYRAVLQSYLAKNTSTNPYYFSKGKMLRASSDRLARDTIKQLDKLDLRLQALKPAGDSPIAASGANAP